MQSACVARRDGLTARLPVRASRLVRRERFFNYLVLSSGEGFYMRKRTEPDIWRGLYEFPLVETAGLTEGVDQLRITGGELFHWLDAHAAYRSVVGPFRQELTHQRVITRFWHFSLEGSVPPAPPQADWCWVERATVGRYPFPRQIDWFLGQKGLTLGMF